MLKNLFGDIYNAPLIAAGASWLAAQIIKTVFHIVKYRTFNPERIFGAGGMPSSHTATVSSLAAVICRMKGPASVEFAFAVILAFVVMYDATGVRRAAGLHAKELNRIRQKIGPLGDRTNAASAADEAEKVKEAEEADKLKEFLGHTPLEVACGALLGILIGLVVQV